MTEKFEIVDEYIASFPPEVREVLEQVRRTIHAAVPGAGEKISYQMPTITLDGTPLLHFSGWKSHLAIYPIPPIDEDLSEYQSGKGTLKFPLDKPIPYDLITRLAQAFLASRRS
ncbi:DUF1801 domain-containing protein [Kribbella sp. NPDC003557]|uniref:iron chaperone n=1 Tax=Kribbella sp. NPDC003557 TaxID=3154449 RepID=UPI0033A05424